MNPDFSKYADGLMPVIIQDSISNKVLMLGFMNEESFAKTNADGKVTFFSRGKQKQHEYFYWEFHENDGRQAMRWGRWKAIKLTVTKISDTAIELYDLDKDPQEINNLATQNPEIVKKMAELFSKEHQYNPDWPLLFKEIKK